MFNYQTGPVYASK
ncbi:Protein of unknown function [Escherichia coli]|nr:Protein of unknown function [Escherichia coli D6-113.11]CDP72629.1 Protein of unknown function [Escherichia coli]CDU35146.1 Protein of unknown function [Escherichia coli D6-113.11]CDU39820.1 Protein of unknown function [Escherichia coli]